MKSIHVDKELITHIVNTYSDMILKIAYQHTKSLTDSEDIVQEVFLSLIKTQIPQDNDYLKALIIRITVNKCKDFHKSFFRRNTVSFEETEPLFTPEEQGVMDRICSLPKKYRDVIYLHYYEGYTIKEIADILKANPNTVSSQLQRGRGLLKNMLEDDFDE